jgi:hypothetical protein
MDLERKAYETRRPKSLLTQQIYKQFPNQQTKNEKKWDYHLWTGINP